MESTDVQLFHSGTFFNNRILVFGKIALKLNCWRNIEMFHFNPIEQMLHFVEQEDQLEVCSLCLSCSRLLTGVI